MKRLPLEASSKPECAGRLGEMDSPLGSSGCLLLLLLRTSTAHGEGNTGPAQSITASDQTKLSHTAFVKVELFSATHSFYSSCYSFGAGCVCDTCLCVS